MSKSGQNQALSNQEDTLKQLQDTINSLYQQYNQLGLPALQQLFPELEQTVSGGPSPLINAAEAPVKVATQQAQRQAMQAASGLTNPDQLQQNIGIGGAEQAGLAGDQTLMGALSALQNLIGGQQNLVQGGMSQEPGIASQYGQIAQQLNPWNAISSIVGGVGTVLGARSGGKSTPASTPSAPSSPVATNDIPAGTSPSLIDAYNALGGLQQSVPIGQSPNVSAPTSQLTTPNNYAGPNSYSGMPAFLGAS